MDASEIVTEAVRKALDEVADLPEGAQLRAAVVLLDVSVPDPDDDSEPFTHTVWKCAPSDMSTSWSHGMCSIAAGAMLLAGHPSLDADDE